VRQLVTESCVLEVAGGLAGFVLTAVAWKQLPALVSIPRLAETRADGAVLGFAIAIAIVNGILFGLTPALRVASRGIADSLRDSGAHGSVGCARSRLRSSLVIAEVSVAVMLVLVGGVLIASFLRRSARPGFRQECARLYRRANQQSVRHHRETRAAVPLHRGCRPRGLGSLVGRYRGCAAVQRRE